MKIPRTTPIKRLRKAYLMLAIVALAASAINASAANSEALYEQLSQEVVWIETTDQLGRSLGQGSGLVLGPSLCSTKWPCPDPRYSNANSEGIDILSNFHVVAFGCEITVRTKGGEKVLAAVVYGDSDRDLAILRTGQALKAKPVSFATSYKIGQRVYALGSPKGLGWTFSDGMISGSRTDKGSKFIQTTAPISPGSSGGGLFNEQGELVGMTTLQMREGQNLNFALNLVSAVKELNQLRGGSSTRPLAIDYDEWVIGVIKRSPDRSGDWRSANPKWRKWQECIAAFRIIQTNCPKIIFTAAGQNTPAYVQWEAERRKALANRFSLFPSDVEGLIGALELATDGKQKEELIKTACDAATSHIKFQRYILVELSHKTDARDQFYELFNRLAESLPTKPIPDSMDPVELTLEIEDMAREISFCLARLKERQQGAESEKVKRLEELLREKRWLQPK